jgi:hypothetical protein
VTEFSEVRIAPILYGRRSEGCTEALGRGTIIDHRMP